MKRNPDHRMKSGALGLLGQEIGKIEDGMTVEIVSVEVVEPEPGVGLAGEKEQDASDGRPEQASVTGLVNAPKVEPTFIVYEAGCPAETPALGCVLATVKSLTLIWTVLVGNAVITPPLLAVSVSVSAPIGHIRLAVAPDAVPQLPAQLNVTGQLSGSVAAPLKATVAPVELVPFTV
jgi:hypothetical protein